MRGPMDGGRCNYQVIPLIDALTAAKYKGCRLERKATDLDLAMIGAVRGYC